MLKVINWIYSFSWPGCHTDRMINWITKREKDIKGKTLTDTEKYRTHTDGETDFKRVYIQLNGHPCTLDINTSEKTPDTCCDKSFMMCIFHGVYTMDSCEYTSHVLGNLVWTVMTYLNLNLPIKYNWAALTCIIRVIYMYTVWSHYTVT